MKYGKVIFKNGLKSPHHKLDNKQRSAIIYPMRPLQKLKKHIYIYYAPNLSHLGTTFCRFSEFAESPVFKNKIFTLKEYKKWYKSYYKNPKFTYCQDYNGFNIPDYIFTPFLQGKFDPLSKLESQLLQQIQNLPKPFYIIGVSLSSQDAPLILKHELAHAYFQLSKSYRQKMLQLINQLSTTNLYNLYKELELYGYDVSVYNDEIQAYLSEPDSIDRWYFIKLTKNSKNIIKKMQQLFDKYHNKKTL